MKDVRDYIKKTGGVTLTSTKQIIEHDAGYQVGVGNLGVFDSLDVLLETIIKIDVPLNHEIGVWFDGDKYWLDLTVHVPDLKVAMQLAFYFGEKAIWDWKERKEIYL